MRLGGRRALDTRHVEMDAVEPADRIIDLPDGGDCAPRTRSEERSVNAEVFFDVARTWVAPTGFACRQHDQPCTAEIEIVDDVGDAEDRVFRLMGVEVQRRRPEVASPATAMAGDMHHIGDIGWGAGGV